MRINHRGSDLDQDEPCGGPRQPRFVGVGSVSTGTRAAEGLLEAKTCQRTRGREGDEGVFGRWAMGDGIKRKQLTTCRGTKVASHRRGTGQCGLCWSEAQRVGPGPLSSTRRARWTVYLGGAL